MSSLSVINVGTWFEEGYVIHEMVQPSRRPFTVPAGATRYIPQQNYIFEADIGILKVFTAAFDDAHGGIRIEYPPNFDTDLRYTVLNFMSATSRSDSIYAMVPPLTPFGTFLIRRTTDMVWVNWLRLSIINSGTTPITCLAYGYQVALKHKKHEAV